MLFARDLTDVVEELELGHPDDDHVHCPYHEDHNPSAQILQGADYDKQRLWCPVCGKGWDVADVVMQVTGMDFRRARFFLQGGYITGRKKRKPKRRHRITLWSYDWNPVVYGFTYSRHIAQMADDTRIPLLGSDVEEKNHKWRCWVAEQKRLKLYFGDDYPYLQRYLQGVDGAEFFGSHNCLCCPDSRYEIRDQWHIVFFDEVRRIERRMCLDCDNLYHAMIPVNLEDCYR